GKPSRRLTRLHLAEELFRAGVLTREELRQTWERIENAEGDFDPAIDERLDLITAAAAVGAIAPKTAVALRARVHKE
ncbi:MAG: hypothetical protein P1V36_12575, partial [Planctomycetota bacterium]|nr:hypothetical protein [Planctomycetota bacterium]